MRRSAVIASLEACVAKESNALWHGRRALAKLPAGIDPKLVERAMRFVFPHVLAKLCARLLPEYVPVAWRVVAKLKTSEAAFFQNLEFGDPVARLHAGATWLTALAAAKTAAQLDALASDRAALDAARAAVVARGAHPDFVRLLAHDGDDASIDALIPVIDRALKTGGKELDQLGDLLRTSRGPRIASIRTELDAARAQRNSESPVLALVRSFGEKRARATLDFQIDSTQRRPGLTRKASAWIVLDSTRVPNVAATVSWNTYNHQLTRWEDGTLIRNAAKVGAPRGLADLPRWLAASAKKLGITWDRRTLRITTTLRGKVSDTAVTWLLSP